VLGQRVDQRRGHGGELGLHVHAQAELAGGSRRVWRADAPPPASGCAALPAMPTRLRTVDEGREADRVEAARLDHLAGIGGAAGAARTVRYAVTSSISQPRSRSPAARVSVAMSARRQQHPVHRVEECRRRAGKVGQQTLAGLLAGRDQLGK